MLAAVKNGGALEFKSAYSRHIRNDTKQSDWNRNLEEARSNLKRYLGEYEVDTLVFGFDPTDNARAALARACLRTDETCVSLKVIKENGQWKLDEH